jgi:hypothetical protein
MSTLVALDATHQREEEKMDCPAYPNRVVYIEHKPEEYTGPLSITIRCRPSEQLEAELIAAQLGAYEKVPK